jgi:hypothetical protein
MPKRHHNTLITIMAAALFADENLMKHVTPEEQEILGLMLGKSDYQKALTALERGEWDNPCLMVVGPLHTDLSEQRKQVASHYGIYNSPDWEGY